MAINVSISRALAYGADEPVPATGVVPDVLVAVRNQLDGRVEHVAKRLGWSKSTLQKKIKGDEKHVFSVRDLQLVQHVLSDIPATKMLAAAEGYVCIKVNPAAVASVAEGLARMQVLLGDFALAIHEATEAGGAVSLNAERRVRHAEAELLGCVNAVGAFVASKVPARDGER